MKKNNNKYQNFGKTRDVRDTVSKININTSTYYEYILDLKKNGLFYVIILSLLLLLFTHTSFIVDVYIHYKICNGTHRCIPLILNIHLNSSSK